jgi:hypothetical protein
MGAERLDSLIPPPARLQLRALLADVTAMEFGTARDILGVSESVLSRVRTHWSQPEDDSGREGNRWASVVAGGDATPVFQAAEHDLDAAATPVAAFIVSDRLVARSPT